MVAPRDEFPDDETPTDPAPLQADLVLTEQDQMMLRLLREGLTDESVAKRLGVSVRSVRRRCSEIGVLLGANGRFQLGYIVSASGLI